MADFNGTVIPFPDLEAGSDWNGEYDGLVIPLTFGESTPTALPLFRALVGSEYVYFTGAPPMGATDIVIVSVP